MNLINLGLFLSSKRKQNNFASSVVAEKIGVSASYYSRIENGKERPSTDALENISKLYDLAPEDILLLKQFAGYEPVNATNSQPQTINTEDNAKGFPPINVKIDPEKNRILFSDGMYISISDNGVVFDFGQKVGPNNEQVIVARIGVSYRHAEKIHKLLGEQLENAKNMGIEN